MYYELVPSEYDHKYVIRRLENVWSSAYFDAIKVSTGRFCHKKRQIQSSNLST